MKKLLFVGAVAVSTFLTMWLSLQAGLFFVWFAILAWWVWEKPENGLLFFIVTASLLPILKITTTIETISLSKDVIIFVLFAKFFLLPLLQKKLPYRRNIFWWPIFALAVWTAINIVRADNLILGILRARDIALFVLLYFAVLWMPLAKSFWKKAATWFVASGAVVAVLAVVQYFFFVDSAVLRFDPVRSIWIPRVSSTLAHPSILGEYLAILFLFLVSILLTSRVVSKKDKRDEAAGWAGPFTILVLLAVVIFLTYSRAVWIGLAAALGVMLVRLLYVRFKKILLAGFVLAILVGMASLFTPAGVYVRALVDPTYGSNAERLEFAARLIAPMTSSEAILGRGLGDVLSQQFREVTVTTFDVAAGATDSIQEAKNKTLVDNQFLKTFVELGLVGFLIYLWIYWVFLKSAWQKNYLLGLWALGFGVAFVVQGLFIDIWEIFPTNAAFWLVAAFLSKASLETAPTVDQE